MGNDENLQKTMNQQDVKKKEIKVTGEEIKENNGMPPVINPELEKVKNAPKKEPLFKEESISINYLAGVAITEYDKLLLKDQKEKKAVDVEYDRFDNMTMKEVLEAMENDTNTKHQAFMEMLGAFRTLVNFSEYYNKAVSAGKTPMEYTDVFRIAETTARFYQVSHKKWIFGTSYGKDRYKLSCRILDIIKGLKVYARNTADKVLRQVDEKVENAQIEKIVEDQQLTDKEKGAVIGEWLVNGKVYTDVLKKMLKDEKLLEKDRLTLARIVADKNRRMVANKVTLSIVAEENPQLTMGLNDLKQKLNKYLTEKIEANDESKKLIFEDVADFRTLINKFVSEYKDENKVLLGRTAKRKEKFVEELGIDENDTRFWARSDINALLINSEDNVFELNLNTLKEQSSDNLAIIDQFIDDLGYSSLSTDSIREKIRKDLGPKLLSGGEIEMAEFVKDAIKKLRFLAANEFEGELRITHLMDVLQLPKSERDTFAKFISGDGTIGGILSQKTSQLRKKGDIYVNNLKGIKEAEKLSRNKKLVLKAETWEKIEELKKNMGTYDKKAFKAELDRIIKANAETIDLTKPNISFAAFNKSRSKERVRRDIGFTNRILGDLFLESKDISSILNKEEKAYFKENLIKNLCKEGGDIGELEFLPTGAIKSIAIMLKKNLVENKDFIKDLRSEHKNDQTIVNEVLMKMCLSKEFLNISDLNDMVMQVKEKHEYDGRIEEEKKKLIEALKAGGSNNGTLSQERYIHFLKQLDFLRKFRLGKYSLFAEKLISQNDVFLMMMNHEQKDFENFLEKTVDKKMGVTIDAINEAKFQKAFKEIYIDLKFDLLYQGKMEGGAALVKDDMRKEQKKYFDNHGFDEKAIDKNIVAATNEAVKTIVGKEKKNAGAVGTVYSCVEMVVSDCYNHKDKLNILSSKTAIADEIKKTYNRYDDNKAEVLQKIKELAEKNGSVFFGYGNAHSKEAGNAYLNAAGFMKTINAKMMQMDKDDFLREFPALLENYEKVCRVKQAESEKEKVTKEELEKGKDIQAKKANEEKVRTDRDKFIGLDKVSGTIEDIFTRKALVTIGTKGGTALSHDNWQKTRDYIKKEISKYYDLDPFLVDLIVEKNVNEVFGDKIEVHSKWLYNIDGILGSADEKEEKISADERKLLVVNAYRHMEDFADKDRKGKYRDDRKFIKTEWYKTFRKNYKLLRKLEELKIEYAPLAQERINMSRQLRALLSTGIGIKEQDKDAKENFSDIAKRAYAYIGFVNEFMKSADAALMADDNYKKESKVIRDYYLLSFRRFFNDKICGEVKDASDFGFDEKAWNNEFKTLVADKLKLRFVCSEAINASVSNKTFAEKNRNFSSLMGRDSIEKLIKEEGSHGCSRKYNKLSEEEKELFALGLMLMEKGAIGFDAGSVSVLSDNTLREKEVEPKLAELAKYMAGGDYDFRIDYDQAYYKLTNIGLNIFGNEKRAFSSSAFEKAWEFAKAITGKMQKKDTKATKEDKLRMGDGISSIYEAALLGKNKQIDEVDELRKSSQTAESVKQKLLKYAELDKNALVSYEKVLDVAEVGDKIPATMPISKITKAALSNTSEEILARRRVVKRLEKMDEVDMYRLLAILQNRAVLDGSSEGNGKHIDEEKREELKLLFSEDDQEKAFAQFAKPGACMQALITALSFKIEDKRSLKDTTLTKKDFDSKSYDRKSLVDWRILDEAFKFLDEMEHDRLVRYALRNAPEYIEASGNQKAIDAYKENLKGKAAKDIHRDTLEKFLKKEADKDRTSKDNEDAKLALAGYAKLTEDEKKLFIKVLGRRDFLDISKKNLYLNIFRYSKERNFANETGRFRLIDEYIDQSLGGNKGVTLSDSAYLDAFKSLLSTQVDDTADFTSVEHIGDILAKEKYYIAKRDTAVDWKLFKRALQFVKRASYELEIREGNDELYRSAGDLTRFGHLSMDYSILRRNIHNTGNQFLRFGAQQAKTAIAKDAIKDIKLFNGKNFYELKKDVKDAVSFVMPSFATKIDKLDELLEVDVKKKDKRIEDLPEFLTKDLKKYDVKGMVTKQLIGKIYTENSSLTNEINELVINAFSNGVKVDKIGDLIKKEISKRPESGKEKRLDSLIGDYKVEHQYGDIRDEINSITAKYNEIKALPDKYKKEIKETLHIDTVEQILNLEVASSIKEIIENQYASAMAYVLSKVDVSKAAVIGEIEDKPFVKDVKEIVEKTMKEYKKTDKDLNEFLKKPQKIVDYLQGKAKEVTGNIIEGAIGKEGVSFIKDKTQLLTDIAGSLASKVSWAINKVNKYKVYIDGFRDIALSIKNKNLLGKAEGMSKDQETLLADEETLKKSEEFETERQKSLKNNVVAEHRDLQNLSKETANTIQNIAIAEDVIKMSVALGEEIFGKLDAGVATGVVKAAVNAGIEFATYCIRCMQDRKMLKTYYTETDRGQKVVSGIKNSYAEMVGSKQVMEAELMNRDTLDLVCTGSGYENKDELVRDTGLKMATSIAFCASNFNPVKETKVMATTVMLVLGLKDKIGKTDAATITGIFDKMKSA